MTTASLPPPRGLATEEEVEAWATFVAASFAFKKPVPPSRAHFLRHFQQDPYSHDRAFIRAVLDETGGFVAVARLVLRPLRLGGWGAGVAEVCVAPTYRGRGLAQVMVQDVLAVAASLASPVPRLSFLHCAPFLVSVYTKFGYQVAIPTRWAHVSLVASQHGEPAETLEGGGTMEQGQREQQDGGTVCCLDLTSSDSTALLHEMAALPRPVPDVMRREAAYWLSWIRGEVLGAGRNMEVWGLREADGRLAAYCILRRPQQPDAPWTVMDMGVVDGRKALPVLLQLASAAVAAAGAADAAAGGGGGGGGGDGAAPAAPAVASREEITVRLPAAFLDGKEAGKTNVPVKQEEVDPGWMYRPLPGQEESVEWQAFHAQYVQEGEQQYLIWPIDNF